MYREKKRTVFGYNKESNFVTADLSVNYYYPFSNICINTFNSTLFFFGRIHLIYGTFINGRKNDNLLGK